LGGVVFVGLFIDVWMFVDVVFVCYDVVWVVVGYLYMVFLMMYEEFMCIMGG